MAKTFEEISDDLKELREEIKSSSKDMELDNVASWVIELVKLNEKLCERLESLSEEIEELEEQVSAMESNSTATVESGGKGMTEGDQKEGTKKTGFWNPLRSKK